ncbi:MAG TPA: energy-coupling factor transporter transmembrane component T [Halanaerobiales bacterium]|nr:energy-coupling factor transporter transmembrane component T [Halanaerobiales bacterium]
MKLDPRTKLLMVFSLSSLAVFIKELELLIPVMFIALLLVYFLGGELSVLKKHSKFLLIFIGIAVIQSIFSPSGEVLLNIGSLKLLTTGGLVKGVRVILRMFIIIVSATIMLDSNSREIIQGLIQWKVPYELAFMVSLAIRFLPLLGEEARDVYTAIQLRGIEVEELPLKKRFKLYSYLLMPVLSGVMVRAREISTSLECRAFRAYPQRSSYQQLQFQTADYLIVILSLIFTAVVLTISFIL